MKMKMLGLGMALGVALVGLASCDQAGSPVKDDATRIKTLEGDVSDLTGRVDDLETKVNDLEDLETKVRGLEDAKAAHDRRLDSLEEELSEIRTSLSDLH